MGFGWFYKFFGFLGSIWNYIGGIPFIGSYTQRMIVSFALGKVSQELADNISRAEGETFYRGIKANSTSNVAPIPVIYGTRLVGVNEYRAVSGENNEFFWRIMVLGEGEIDSIEKVFFNNEDIVTTRKYYDPKNNEFLWEYDNQTSFSYYLENGTTNQTAPQALIDNVEGWSDLHTGTGIAYFWLRLRANPTVFTQGIPNVTALVKGKKLYDPRKDSSLPSGGNGSHRQTDPSTWEWSENPTLCVLDFMTNPIYGRGIAYDEIDMPSFQEEANHCDEVITLIDASGNEVPNQKRYTCNGVVNPDDKSVNILKQLLTSCRGAIVVSDKYKMKIDKADTSVFTFDESNIVGGWQISGNDTNTRKNRATVRFFDKDNNFDETFTVVKNAGGAVDFEVQDNGRVLETDMFLPYTNTHVRANILAQHHIKQSRQNWKVSFTTTMAGFAVEAMDVVRIKHSILGWDSGDLSNGKLFRVTAVEVMQNDAIKIEAEEYDASVYTFNLNTPPESPDTNLPDPNEARPPQNLILDGSQILVNKDGGITERIYASWDAPASAYFTKYEISWKENSSLNWQSAVIEDNQFFCSPVSSEVDGGLWNVRVRAFYPVGGWSDWYPSEEGEDHIVLGKQAPPSPPSDFSYSQGTNYARSFEWIHSTDVDVAGYSIRYAPLVAITDIVDWEAMSPLTVGLVTNSPYETNLLNAGFYRFGIKAVDTSGNESEIARYVSVELEDSPVLNILQAYYPRLLGWGSVGSAGLVLPTQFQHKVLITGTAYETITMDFVSSATRTLPNGSQKVYAYYKSGLVADYASNFGSESGASYHLRIASESNVFFWRVQRVEDSTSDSGGTTVSNYSYSYRNYDVSTAPEPPAGLTAGYGTDGSPLTTGGELIAAGTRTQTFGSVSSAEVDIVTGDLVSASTSDEEWDDLTDSGGDLDWDEWENWSFASSTLTYETNGFEFGTDLTFRPVLQANALGTVTHQVAIVPDTSSATSPFSSSDYGSFFTPSGEVTAKAIRTRTTVVGVNATLTSLSILLDGKRLEEELVGIDTSGLSSNYRVAAGHIHLPLQKAFTSVQSIQIIFNNAGSQRTFEVLDKTNTVSSVIAPTVKLYNGSSLADATIDIIVRGY